MKQTSILFLVCSFLLFSFYSFKNQENFNLTVEVGNLRNSKGVVQVALYNKEGSIPDEHYKNYFKMERVKINDGKAKVVFSNLPQGIYALNVLHDENNNGKIDKGLIKPKEGIGFSNYTKIGLTNKPNYKKASFELKHDRMVRVMMIYM